MKKGNIVILMKKFFRLSTILVLVFIMLMIPARAFAETEFGITVTQYPESAEGLSYEIGWEEVIVRYPSPCKLGYLSDGRYLFLRCIELDDGAHLFTIPADSRDVALAIYGDVNLDGHVSQADSTKIKAFLKETTTLDIVQQMVADTNPDNRITLSDSTKIKAFLKGNAYLYWDMGEEAEYSASYYLQTEPGSDVYTPDSSYGKDAVGVSGIGISIRPFEIEGYAIDEDNEGNLRTGVLSKDSKLELKLYYKVDADGNGIPDDEEEYTVTFLDDDGTTILSSAVYMWGTRAEDIETPLNYQDYIFTGWDPEVTDVTQSASYTATYNKAVEFVLHEGGDYDGKYTFKAGPDIDKVDTITIPQTHKNIDVPMSVPNGFENCENLVTVNLSPKVRVLHNYTFQGCTALKNIDLTEADLTAIGRRVFSGCTSLETVTIPDTLVSLGLYIFENCTSLKTAVLNNTFVRAYMFYGCSALNSVTLADSITSIEYNAFENCTSLKQITIPEAVTEIGKKAFFGSGLTKAHFGDGFGWTLSSKAAASGTLDVGTYTEDWNKSINFGVTYITGSVSNGEFFIHLCEYYPRTESQLASALSKTVSVPARIMYCKTNVFDTVNGIYRTYTGNISAEFYDQKWVKRTDILISEDGLLAYEPSSAYEGTYSVMAGPLAKTQSNIVIPSSFNGKAVTTVTDAGFKGVSTLTGITIPDSVKKIGALAFYKCPLTSVTIPSSVELVDLYAFGSCDSLTSADIRAKKIGHRAFYVCRNLTTITFSGNVKDIGQDAFVGSYTLTTLTIPSSVTRIGEAAFMGSTALKTVYMKNAVIGRHMFYNCSALEKVYATNHNISVGEGAFEGCPLFNGITYQ